jgi:SAM-dependent methyltransferase
MPQTAIGVMNHLHHNRAAWNSGSVGGGVWSTPVDSSAVARARTGQWQVILTPKLPVPREWFGDVRGKNILCLASGGGQQVPIFAAAGANVVSFDLSDEQLAKDRMVAEREGLDVRCIQGDMADLSCFSQESFDLVFHPASNAFVPDLAPVWQGCYRVLRPGGHLLAGFMNPAVFMFDHEEADETNELTVKYALPYSDVSSLSSLELQRKLDEQEPIEFSHSLETQIGGQINAGFHIVGLYEDHWFDDTWLFSNFSPVCIATRALRPE